MVPKASFVRSASALAGLALCAGLFAACRPDEPVYGEAGDAALVQDPTTDPGIDEPRRGRTGDTTEPEAATGASDAQQAPHDTGGPTQPPGADAQTVEATPASVVCADDGNPCTKPVWSEKTGCKFEWVYGGCDLPEDANPCTGGGTCVAGECVAKNVDAMTCALPDDGDPCTEAVCMNGKCVLAKPFGAACSLPDDGNPCTGTGYCDYGKCVAKHLWGSCDLPDDGNPCTGGTCAAGQCIPKNLDWTACSVADDGNPCTGGECHAGKCITKNIYGPCDTDDYACTSAGFCSSGQCLGQANTCADGNPCTEDLCSNVGCIYKPLPGTCSDGNACTTDDACKTMQCIGKLKGCDDANVCTTDACDPVYGCVNQPLWGSCPGGDICKVGTCTDGTCKTAPKTCDDAYACTVDACASGKGCQHTGSTWGWVGYDASYYSYAPVSEVKDLVADGSELLVLALREAKYETTLTQMARLSSDGKRLWTQAASSTGARVAVGPDGNTLIVSPKDASTKLECVQNDKILWTKLLAPFTGQDAAWLFDGWAVAGSLDGEDAEVAQVHGLTSNGKLAWTWQPAGQPGSRLQRAVALPNAAVVAGTVLQADGKSRDPWLVKLGIGGAMAWQVVLAGVQDETVREAVALSNGAVLVLLDRPASQTQRLVAVSAQGAIAWEPAAPLPKLLDIAPVLNGGFAALTGDSVLRFDAGGSLVATQALDFALADKKAKVVLKALATRADGQLAVAGDFTTQSSYADSVAGPIVLLVDEKHGTCPPLLQSDTSYP